MENIFKIDLGGMAAGEAPKDADVIIIGGGPAGLTAALYCGRAGLKTVIIEKLGAGGQITVTDHVENYPGVESIKGPELSGIMEKQAKTFGAFIAYDEVTGVNDNGKIKTVETASGAKYTCISLIIASGVKYKELGAPGEAKFKGRGVSNCATCDAAFYKNLDVAVIGGGDTAVEEGAFLTKFAKKVYLIHRRDRLRAAKIIQDRALKNPKMEFIFESVLEEISGVKTVEKIKIKNLKTDALREIPVAGVFVFVGFVPVTEFVKGFVDMDAGGYIKADSEMRTSREGVFACGDCIVKDLRQVVTAAGDGATAAFKAQHWVEKSKGTEYV